MRPIIFDAESVRAILAGRKTQFRVPLDTAQLTLRPGFDLARDGKDANRWTIVDGEARLMLDAFNVAAATIRLPFGGPGARVFVQEKHVLLDRDGWWDMTQPRDALDPMGRRNGVAYADNANDADSERCRRELGYRWRSPVCMPRWASRLTLEIVSVRVEQVQEITEADCIAEGIASHFRGVAISGLHHEYAVRWDALNAKRGYPWASNPWVFAREFRTITPTAADAAGDSHG